VLIIIYKIWGMVGDEEAIGKMSRYQKK